MFGRGRDVAALKRIADALYDAAPFTQPEVVDWDRSVALRLKSAPETFELIFRDARSWVTGSVVIDSATGAPKADAFSQRLMRDTLRPIRVPLTDLQGVVVDMLASLMRDWTSALEGPFALEGEDRAFAKWAIEQVKARMRDPRPPVQP